MVSMRPIFILAVSQTLIWASLFYIFPALLLRWEADLGWSRAEITGAITLAVLISGLASPLTGRIIDKGHGALLMAGSALLGAIAIATLSQVQTLWQFYVVWGLAGLATAGSLYEPCFSIITRARGAKAQSAITIITLLAGFASTLSFPLVNLSAEAFGWRSTALIAAAVIAFVVAPLHYIGVRGLGPPDPASQKVETGKGTFLSRPAFWFLAFGFAATALVHGAVLHHLLPILDERSLSAPSAIAIASLIGPSQVAGRIVMVGLGRFVAANGLALIAFTIMGASVAVLLFAGSGWRLYAFVTMFGGAYGTMSILRPVLARQILGPERFGAKSGSLALPYLIFAAVAPYLGALIWGTSGYDVMLASAVVLTALGMGLYSLAYARRKG